MSFSIPSVALQLRSLISASGELTLSLVLVPVPEPADDEVLIRVEASPINPSDQGLLFGAADMSRAEQVGSSDLPVIKAPVPAAAMASMAGRVDEALPVGNEGSGTVVAAGASAQALLGRKVALMGGAMYSEYRLAKARQCLQLPDDATAAEGASCFINPLTALGMVETMRAEGHKALVHTAAASNLGQMLVRICQKDGVELVNIVRSPEQVALLTSLGARYVCDSTAPNFSDTLTDALAATGATIAFDATSGGTLASRILSSMEAALGRNAREYSRYGSTTHKQVYLYGSLDRSPTVLERNYGMAWGVGGWLLTPFLQRIGAQGMQRLRERVAAELKTTFASRYTRQISLAQALSLDAISVYNRRATGEKFLIKPDQTV
jgi:NADPH2:quinone reductase